MPEHRSHRHEQAQNFRAGSEGANEIQSLLAKYQQRDRDDEETKISSQDRRRDSEETRVAPRYRERGDEETRVASRSPQRQEAQQGFNLNNDAAAEIQRAIAEFDRQNSPAKLRIEPGSAEALALTARLREQQGGSEVARRVFGDNQPVSAAERQALNLANEQRAAANQERMIAEQKRRDELARLRRQLEGGSPEEDLPIRRRIDF